MLSNKERGRAFQILCRDALRRALGRDVDLEVPIEIGGGKRHSIDLATRERDILAECKAFAFNPSAKITTLREAAMYLRSVEGNVVRLLIVKHDLHATRGETIGALLCPS
jgi:hypothetical protein